MGRPMSMSLIQGFYEISATRNYPLGFYTEDPELGGFQYARAGASALSAGMLGVAPAINAAHMNEAILETIAVGTDVLKLTVTAGAAITEDYLKGGQFQVNAGAGIGTRYVIEGNSEISATGTEIIVTLRQPLKVALTTASYFTLVHNPCQAVVQSTTPAALVGVPLVAVTAAYYYWAQCKGLASVYTHTTTTVGYMVQQSVNTAGYVDTKADTETGATVGYLHGTAGVNANCKPVVLTIR